VRKCYNSTLECKCYTGTEVCQGNSCCLMSGLASAGIVKCDFSPNASAMVGLGHPFACIAWNPLACCQITGCGTVVRGCPQDSTGNIDGGRAKTMRISFQASQFPTRGLHGTGELLRGQVIVGSTSSLYRTPPTFSRADGSMSMTCHNRRSHFQVLRRLGQAIKAASAVSPILSNLGATNSTMQGLKPEISNQEVFHKYD